MKVSVVIPVINEAAQVRLAIDRAWNCGADEVIVVDGGSDDLTQKIASEANCTLVVSPSGSGRAIQMNLGAKSSSGDILVFIHADNWLDENACAQIRESLNSGQYQYGAFRQRIENRAFVYRWIESGNLLRVRWQGLIYGDQSMFIQKTLFEELGGFPEIALMEDFSFSQIVGKTGKPLILDGPTFVSARRWQKKGPVRQTLQNWFLAFAYRIGVSPAWIANRYRRHDQ